MKQENTAAEEGVFDAAQGLRLLLQQPCRAAKEDDRFAAYGLKKKQRTNGMLLLIHLLELANSGNASAMKEVLSLCGTAEGGKQVILIDDIPLA